MNPQHNQRIQALFEAAISLPSHDQAAFLRQHCGGDVELERRVQELLVAAGKPSLPYVRPLQFMAPPGSGDDTVQSMDVSFTDGTAVGGTARDLTGGYGAAGDDVGHFGQVRLGPGTAIGQYELIHELDRGGMGADGCSNNSSLVVVGRQRFISSADIDAQ